MKRLLQLFKRTSIPSMLGGDRDNTQKIATLDAKTFEQYISSKPGTETWLIASEFKYGGFHTNVPRGKVSPADPRSKVEIETGGMTGGDRMLHHGYAAKYGEYLSRFVDSKQRMVLVEVGILRGNGLAIWSDLFKTGRIIGLDIDLSHTINNMSSLKSRGAFASNTPELYEFDQFLENESLLRGILKKDAVDICIDDGLHSEETVLTTFRSVLPLLNREFVYFIEDNSEVHKVIRSRYPGYAVENWGELTIVSR